MSQRDIKAAMDTNSCQSGSARPTWTARATALQSDFLQGQGEGKKREMESGTKFLAELFFMVWLVASFALFFNYWHVLTNWLGGALGTVVALFAAPGVFVFPLIYWFARGTFPTFYFELLGVCVVSGIVWGSLWWGTE